MAENVSFKPTSTKKSFWKRPEGITGAIFLLAIIAAVTLLLVNFGPALVALLSNTLYLAGLIVVLGALLYMVFDPKMRNLIWYMYKSAMRWVTGLFVQIDPIGILKSYVEDLEDNLGKMRKQIGTLRGQMRKIDTLMTENGREIENQMKMASAAKEKGMDQQMLLASRKAARLKETNGKYKVLHDKMEVLNRILVKMHSNSEVLLEDTRDQVKLKEQERKAIRASHSAMKSAMSVISGDPDKRAMFDAAMEAVADDVANKVGEMERFMELSAHFMESVDLQNGLFEEEGLKMLGQWEKDSTLLRLEGAGRSSGEKLALESPRSEPEVRKESGSSGSNYDNLFQ